MNRFNRKELENMRVALANACRIPSNSILINELGHFEIHQVSEREKNSIVGHLRREDYVIDVSASPSGYNFNRMTYPGLPERKYTIQGNVSTENPDVDDNFSGMI